jgi:hypothetical protein
MSRPKFVTYKVLPSFEVYPLLSMRRSLSFPPPASLPLPGQRRRRPTSLRPQLPLAPTAAFLPAGIPYSSQGQRSYFCARSAGNDDMVPVSRVVGGGVRRGGAGQGVVKHLEVPASSWRCWDPVASAAVQGGAAAWRCGRARLLGGAGIRWSMTCSASAGVGRQRRWSDARDLRERLAWSERDAVTILSESQGQFSPLPHVSELSEFSSATYKNGEGVLFL